MIEKRTLPSGSSSYRVRWYRPDGREESKSFSSARAARAFDVERRAAGDAWASPAARRITVDRVFDRFMESAVHLKPSTRHMYERVYLGRIGPAFGRWPVGKVDRGAVQSFVTALSGEVSPRTVRGVHRVLHLVLADAVAHGNLSQNPATGVRLPRVTRYEAQPLSVSQVRALEQDIRERCPDAADLVLVLAFTGLRWAEAVALRRVDVSCRSLRVVRTLSEVAGKVTLSTPKTHQSRTVPVARPAHEVLARRCDGRDDDDLILTTPGGAIWRNSNFRRQTQWGAATYRVTGRHGVRVHDLRHTAASIFIEAGATVVDVAGVLGHASPTTTLNVYAHLLGDRLDTVRALADERISAVYGQNAATPTVGETESTIEA